MAPPNAMTHNINMQRDEKTIEILVNDTLSGHKNKTNTDFKTSVCLDTKQLRYTCMWPERNVHVYKNAQYMHL